MKIAIHQPEHFPYLGFFQKMKAADIFVILDDVQFTKGNFQHRNRFLNNKGKEEWFTIPLEKKPHHKCLIDINLSSIKFCKEKLNITTPLILSSDLEIKTKGSQKLTDICKALAASEYLSGQGAKKYLDESIFNCKVSFFKPKIKNHYSILQHI